jgi:hypothetical protein
MLVLDTLVMAFLLHVATACREHRSRPSSPPSSTTHITSAPEIYLPSLLPLLGELLEELQLPL